MSESWQYQLRVQLPEQAAAAARKDADNALLAPLTTILRGHDVALVNQLTAFENYLTEAEAGGIEHFPLYRWTKAVVEDPAKRRKYGHSFTLHVAGQEVYDKAVAEALEADLQPLVGGELVTRIFKYDTNPQNNPQAPAQYRS
jgi:hypothetical protein